MSIIVEALKKAQGSLKTTLSTRGRNAPSLPPPEMRKPRIKKHIGVWVFTSLILLAAASFYFLNRNLTKKDLLPISPAPTITGSVALKEEPAALKEEESPQILFPSPSLASVPAPTLTPAPSPATAPAASPPPLTLAVVNKAIDLDGIMYTPKKPLAIINGGVWGEGDYIGKFKISKIEKDFVKITSEGQEFIIRLRR